MAETRPSKAPTIPAFWGERERGLFQTLSIVASVFGLIGIGYLAARTRLLSADVGEKLAEFVFVLAIPILIFATLARAETQGVPPLRIWLAYFVPFAVVWALSHLMVVRLFGRDRRAGVVAGGSAAYSNAVLIGVPLVQTALGDDGMVFLIVIVLVHLPILTAASMIFNQWALAVDGDAADAPSRGEALRKLVVSLATHPILIAIALGILWNVTGLPIPGVAAAVIDPLALSAGPLALFATGMALASSGFGRQIVPAFGISVLKLAVLPGLVFASAWAIGLSPLGIAALTLTAACPTGVNAPLIAIRLGTGEALSSNALLISTAGGVVTVALWLSVVLPLVEQG